MKARGRWARPRARSQSINPHQSVDRRRLGDAAARRNCFR
jgi:hypothetical protein